VSFQGTVEAIYLSSEAGAPLHAVDKVALVQGLGVEGDRYFLRKGSFSKKPRPDRQVTLIEIEAIEALRNRGLDVGAGDPRRNIVTRGVPLNHLVGRRFMVGDATLLGVKLCEPCTHLADLTSKEISDGLVHRGGLRAEIVEGSVIEPGNVVRLAEAQSDAAETR
jgi:MOSC domain-containing protein YiiM